jgi:hypothetical protein
MQWSLFATRMNPRRGPMKTSADDEIRVLGLWPSDDVGRQKSSSTKVRRLTGGMALIAALLLAGCGGDDSGDDANRTTGDVLTQTDDPGDAGGDDVGAVAAFEDWAETLRAMGHSISFQNGGDAQGQISELVLGGLDGVEWAAASASIINVENGLAELRPDGDQEISIQIGERISIPITAEIVRVRVNDDSPESTHLEFEFVGVAVGSSLVESMAVSGGTGVTIALRNTRLDDGLGGPLGDTISSFDVLVTETSMAGTSARLTAASMNIRWGLLDLEGTGTLEIDPNGAWSGLVDARIFDVLSVLDAFRAYESLDREALADVYAAFIEEMPTTEGGIPVVLELDLGTVTLLGGARGLLDLSLGTSIRLLDATTPP